MNNPLMQLITSAANEPKLLQENNQLAQQNIQLVVTINLIAKRLSELVPWTIEETKKRYLQEALEILQKIQTTSKTTEEAKARLLEYLEQFE